jgi:RNA-binding protein
MLRSSLRRTNHTFSKGATLVAGGEFESSRSALKIVRIMAGALSNREKRELKARAQKLEPILRLGPAGVSDAFVKSLDEALSRHGLVKIRFGDFKEEKKVLSPEIAEKTGSELVMRVGNVAVFYRRPPDAEA